MEKPKWVRIVAMVCVVLLAAMYLATFAAALAAKPYSNTMFLGCLVCTVFVPIFLHIMMWLFSHMAKKKEGETTLYQIHKAKKEQKKPDDNIRKS